MPIRFQMIGLITLGTMINFLDRVNISVAASEIMAVTGWDEARFGWVFSSFLIGYALLQTPGGALADRWSPRRVAGLACIGFSVFTLLTPLGQNAFFVLLTLRLLVGAFEAFTFPAFASLNSRWIPRQEFARAQSVLLSGVYIGQIVAYPSTTWIIETFSWQAVFYTNAALGALWVTLWLWFSTDTPRAHPRIGPAELEHIESNLAAKGEAPRIPLRVLLRHWRVAFLCLSYGIFGFTAWVFILWFPTYLVKARGLELLQMGLVGMIPIAAGFLGVLSGGALSDVLLRRGFSATTARVRVPGACCALSAPFLVAAVTVPSIALSLAGFGLFYFLYSMVIPGYYALPLELDPRAVGAITGVMNTCANSAGFFGPITAGYLVADGGQWALPFYMAAALAVAAGAIYALLVNADPIEIAETA